MPETEEPSVVEKEEAAAAPEPGPAVPESEDFDRLLNSYSQFSQAPLGSLLRGHVVKIVGEEVIVDVGYKCEGVIPAAEFKDAEGKLRIQPGDEIEVMMESTEEREGYVVLSRERAKRLKVWDDIESAYERQSVIPGTVVERIKGGLAVDIGVRAFLPGSQVDVKPLRNLDSLIGEEISCKIIKLNKKRSNIVVSRKAVLEVENNRRKERTLEHLTDGAVVKGTVKNTTDYGAFVDLGGIDGLLHVTDLSWGRVSHPSEVVKVGDELEVKVLKFDREKERVSLGLKQLSEDPWHTAAEKFPVGSRVKGKVLNSTDYGSFVELEQGIEGLIHVSEMSHSKRVKHPSKILSPGDVVETMVLDVHPGDRRISLSLKQCEPNPWETLPERYAVGSVIKGRVRNLTDFGAFVEVEEGIDGLVHVSDISWTKRIKHPSEALKKGEIVQAAVLSIDPEKRRLSLGIKQLQQDAWESFCGRFHVGDVIHGKVVRKATFGVFVELAEGIEGLCHISEISSETVDKHSIPMEAGQESEFKIIKLNPDERKVGLSVKALHAEVERKEADKVLQAASSSTATNTIGDMVAMKERNALKR
jgi:small subunit ribosomal protein S1